MPIPPTPPHLPLLGHAFCRRDHDDPEDELRSFLRFCNGDTPWEPRPPRDLAAVQRAENILTQLGEPHTPRPIYAYLGNLHPDMGQLGLIVRTSWARHTSGVSRCDTGGLAAGHGSFQHVPQDRREAQLRAVSTCRAHDTPLVGCCWEDEASSELRSSYGALARYLQGDPPDTSQWHASDVRAVCIHNTPPTDLDRRLWTWELRIPVSFTPNEVVRVAMTQEAYAALEEMAVDEGYSLPDTIPITATPPPDHPFHHPEVLRAFAS